MPTFSGTVTAKQGVVTIDVTPNDVVTFTPASGTYSVEYPNGTSAIAATGSVATLTGNTSSTQVRILCVSGSVAYSCVDGRDETKQLTAAAAAAAQSAYDATGSFGGAGAPYDLVTISATTLAIRAAPCTVAGFNVTASASGRWKFYDGLDSSGLLLYDGTVILGQVVTFAAPFSCFVGLSVYLTSGTGTINISVR